MIFRVLSKIMVFKKAKKSLDAKSFYRPNRSQTP